MNYKKLSCFITICLLVILVRAEPSSSKKISLNYENEDLVNVINYVASQKNINVILPMKADQKITGKFSWQLDKKVTIDEAWNLLSTILDIAGYSIIPKAEYHEIVKNSKDVSREPVPLYVGTPLDDLPPSDQRIRYIYYLSNIKLQQGEGRQVEIDQLLKALLPPDTAGSTFKIDVATNAILLMAPSTDVYSVMQVIMQLDRPGFQEKLEVLPLLYAKASVVANLFNNNILQTSDQQGQYQLNPVKNNDAQYFSKNLRIIANDRTNSLIMVGRLQAIERIKEFVNQYIDVQPESGNSILHVYQLQYLDAPSFAEVLKNIVQSKTTEGTEQSTGAAAKTQGPERFFEGVLIAVDTPKPEDFKDIMPQPAEGQEATLPPTKYYGGNNLIIAARGDDWKRIKALIEELDQPKPQVLIEVLIVDLTLDDNRILGTMFRNAAKLSMPGEFNVQSAQLAPGIIPDNYANPQTIGVIPGVAAADLAAEYNVNSSGVRSDPVPGGTNTSPIDQFAAGSTAITLNDANGKTWSIAQILNELDQSKVLSHPHIISTHNKEASIQNTITRILPGDTSTGVGGAVEQKQIPVDASLKVKFRPRISSAQAGHKVGTVNLAICIDIDQYVSATLSDNTRLTRNVTTNATVNSGDILAIGGLIRTSDIDNVDETPVLSRIPIIGWLFKSKTKDKAKTNLTVFICPTIIEPRLRGGVNRYTEDYVGLQKAYANNRALLDSLKDPITHWFFDTTCVTKQTADNFMGTDELQSKKVTVPVPTTTPTHGTHTRKSAVGLQVAHTKSQADKLKGLLETVENPFKKGSAA